jgi:DNA-binding transcriptional ArsR family regulator
MQNAQAARMARCLKTLSDPNRIRILRILVRGEFCVSDLVSQLQVDQPKVSHHLAILRSAGIIRCRRDGRHINYSLFPAVHQRKSGVAGGNGPHGPVDEFNLGDISVSFCFAADAETTSDSAAATSGAGAASSPRTRGSPGAPGPTTVPGTLRVRVGEMQVTASPAGLEPASASGSAGSGATSTA